MRAARDAMHCEEERSLVLNRRMVGGIAQEIDARYVNLSRDTGTLIVQEITGTLIDQEMDNGYVNCLRDR